MCAFIYKFHDLSVFLTTNHSNLPRFTLLIDSLFNYQHFKPGYTKFKYEINMLS